VPTRRLLATALLLTMAGCGHGGGPPAGAPASSTAAAWVAGTVTRGGAGPCFGFRTDAGTAYALHASDGRALATGERLRVQTRPSKLRIDCGSGQLVELIAVQPLR
jgi:hypothetical protein